MKNTKTKRHLLFVLFLELQCHVTTLGNSWILYFISCPLKIGPLTTETFTFKNNQLCLLGWHKPMLTIVEIWSKVLIFEENYWIVFSSLKLFSKSVSTIEQFAANSQWLRLHHWSCEHLGAVEHFKGSCNWNNDWPWLRG